MSSFNTPSHILFVFVRLQQPGRRVFCRVVQISFDASLALLLGKQTKAALCSFGRTKPTIPLLESVIITVSGEISGQKSCESVCFWNHQVAITPRVLAPVQSSSVGENQRSYQAQKILRFKCVKGSLKAKPTVKQCHKQLVLGVGTGGTRDCPVSTKFPSRGCEFMRRFWRRSSRSIRTYLCSLRKDPTNFWKVHSSAPPVGSTSPLQGTFFCHVPEKMPTFRCVGDLYRTFVESSLWQMFASNPGLNSSVSTDWKCV